MGESVNQTTRWRVPDARQKSKNKIKLPLVDMRSLEMASMPTSSDSSSRISTKKKIVSQRIQAKTFNRIELKMVSFEKHLIYFHRFRLSLCVYAALWAHSNSVRQLCAVLNGKAVPKYFNSSECFVGKRIIQINQFRWQFAIHFVSLNR